MKKRFNFLLFFVLITILLSSELSGFSSKSKDLILISPPLNITIIIPPASRTNGNGNFALPSGRLLHAFKNVELRLSESALPLGIVLTIRCDTEEGINEFINLEDEEGMSYVRKRGWIWNSGEDMPPNVYFALDDLYDDAFGHWIVECAVFLDYWKELRGMFPHIKLLLRQPKRYKKLFLPVFGVAPEDVVYFSGGWPRISESYPLPIPTSVPGPYPLPNLVFFPPGLYASDHLVDIPFFAERHLAFVERVKEYSRSFIDNSSKWNRSVLILPRGKVENLASNDRVIPELDVLAHMVESENIFGAKVLRTDDVKDIRHQVAELANAKVIFVGAGSAAYVNVLFAENATVYALGRGSVMSFSNTFPLNQKIWDLASKKNKLIICEKALDDFTLRILLLDSILSTKDKQVTRRDTPVLNCIS